MWKCLAVVVCNISDYTRKAIVPRYKPAIVLHDLTRSNFRPLLAIHHCSDVLDDSDKLGLFSVCGG